jgi:4-hydroxybutyryl-CoA dehydratase / vinylacetyl-CoA-Delta-isomerase
VDCHLGVARGARQSLLLEAHAAPMRSAEEFLRSLEDGRAVFYRGSAVGSVVEHPVLGICARHAAKLFGLARECRDPALASPISRYYLPSRSSEDLLARHRLIYESTLACHGVFNISQAIGSDALSALSIVAQELDRSQGTRYAARVEAYRQHVASRDLTLAVAQTDAKGDRARRPHEQRDPDLYLRVKEVRPDGIIVTGAKAHTTQAAVSDEIIVLPTRAMGEPDADYAVAFAVPVATPGLTLIARPVEELEGNDQALLSRLDFESETLTIFDNVFVPAERVFLCREHASAGRLAVGFATHHRFTAVSYRAATANLYVGTAALVARTNGISDASHVRDKLLRLVVYKEIMRMSALAAGGSPLMQEGLAVPNPLFTNLGKLYSNQNFASVLEALVDLAGGIAATLPANADFENPVERPFLAKYLAGAEDAERRTKVLRLAKELGVSTFAGYMMALMVHAEGSVEASKLALLRDYDLAEAERMVEGILNPAPEP